MNTCADPPNATALVGTFLRACLHVLAPSSATQPATTVAPTTEPPAPPVRVLVTNDDGIDASGIDAVVQALQARTDPAFEITVVAPATQQSGQVGNITDGPLTAAETTTASGYTAMAVEGFPADSVIWALDHGGIGSPVAEVISINTPTCAVGEIRGTVDVPLAADLQGFDYLALVDCTSTFEHPMDDVQAYFNGFVAVSPTPLQPAGG